MEKKELNVVETSCPPLSVDVMEQKNLLDNYRLKMNLISLEKAAKLDNASIFSRDTLFRIREYIESFLVNEMATQNGLSAKMARVDWKLMNCYSEKAIQALEDAYEKTRRNGRGSSLTLSKMSPEIQNAFYEIKGKKETVINRISQETIDSIPVYVIGMDIIEMMCLSHQAQLAFEEVNTKGYENVAMFSIIKAILNSWLNPQSSELDEKINPNIPINLKNINSDLQTIINRDLKEYHVIRREEIGKFASFVKDKNEHSKILDSEKKELNEWDLNPT